MKPLFIQYPKCTTCKKAKKYLEDNSIQFEDRHIVEANPTKEELKSWIELSQLDVKKFFNTSGVLYREMQLKEKLKELSKDEAIEILASNGMLVKRPLLILHHEVLVGFKEDQYKSIFNIED